MFALAWLVAFFGWYWKVGYFLGRVSGKVLETRLGRYTSHILGDWGSL